MTDKLIRSREGELERLIKRYENASDTRFSSYAWLDDALRLARSLDAALAREEQLGELYRAAVADKSAALTRIEELEKGLNRIINTHGGYPDDYAEIARQVLQTTGEDE